MARGRKPQVHRITSADPGPSRDLRARERTYLIMMSIRFVAIIVAVVVPGFWRWVAIAAGTILPYIAVVTVNAARTKGTEDDPAYFQPDLKPQIGAAPYQFHPGSTPLEDSAQWPPRDP